MEKESWNNCNTSDEAWYFEIPFQMSVIHGVDRLLNDKSKNLKLLPPFREKWEISPADRFAVLYILHLKILQKFLIWDEIILATEFVNDFFIPFLEKINKPSPIINTINIDNLLVYLYSRTYLIDADIYSKNSCIPANIINGTWFHDLLNRWHIKTMNDFLESWDGNLDTLK